MSPKIQNSNFRLYNFEGKKSDIPDSFINSLSQSENDENLIHFPNFFLPL